MSMTTTAVETSTVANAPTGEPAPGSPEALLLLATAGVLPATAAADDPRFCPAAINGCITRLLELRSQQALLAIEHKELQEQLRLAHLRGDLQAQLPASRDGNGYQISPDLALLRRPGRKQWSYSLACKEIECQLKARQGYEQQAGVASYSLGESFWEVRVSRG